jgi:hypothetical protein
MATAQQIPNPNSKKNAPIEKAAIKTMRDKDAEMVKGRFIFHEVPGGHMSFVYRFYKEDPVERYDMWDGEVYTVPRGVAKHLNKNCWYPEYEHTRSEDMQNVQKIGLKKRRCSFQSLEFTDNEDLTPVGAAQLYTVENIGTQNYSSPSLDSYK